MSKAIKKLELAAARSRRNVLRMVEASDHGHLGGAMSCLDIVTALYFYKMNIRPDDPKVGPTATVSCSRRAISAWCSMPCWLSAGTSIRLSLTHTAA